MRKKIAGFTLVEMLITVAIVAVMIAVALPLYGRYISDSHSAACAHNRAALQSSVTVAQLDDRDLTAAELTDIIVEDGANSTVVCPDGGTYSVVEDENGNMTVVCSEHGGGTASH